MKYSKEGMPSSLLLQIIGREEQQQQKNQGVGEGKR